MADRSKRRVPEFTSTQIRKVEPVGGDLVCLYFAVERQKRLGRSMHDPDAIILRIERLPLRRDVGEGDFGGSGSTGGHSPLSER